jgi:prophage DNA circulation protein
MIKVKYDFDTTKVLGYYPSEIKYKGVDVVSRTITDATGTHPYIEIEEGMRVFDKIMCVKGGAYQEYKQDPSVIRADLLAHQIQNIKAQAHTRITAIYPITKQLNLIYAQADNLAEYTTMVAFIEKIRTKSNELEAKIAKYTIKQLETFNCADDKHWTD